MEVYLRAFVNLEGKNWARPLAVVELAYNNAKDASTETSLFESNFKFSPRVFSKRMSMSGRSLNSLRLFAKSSETFFSRLLTQFEESLGTDPFSLSSSQPRLLQIARDVFA